MRAVLIALTVAGCSRPAPRPPLYAAGSEKDEGHGLLARGSSTWWTSEADEPELPTSARRSSRDGDPFGDDPGGVGGAGYGGAAYGGTAYGGAGYASYTPPPWSYPSVNRAPPYTSQAGLIGAVEGVVSWHGAPPPAAATTCGSIDTLHVGADHAIAGALVYIEHLATGRVLAHEGGERRPTTVGGVVVKRGCAFVPTVQIVTPLPAALSIHGDAARAKIRILDPGGAHTFDLAEAGRVAVAVTPGTTVVESDDGTLGAAWVVALDTPAYALTDDAGRFRIDELAAGTYDVSFWLPPLPTVVDGKLRYGAPRIVHRSVTVTTARPAHLDVALGRY